MLVQFEDATVVKAQTFPNGVAPLYRRIKRAHPRFIAVHKPTLDVDDQVAVLGIKFLQHVGRRCLRKAGKQEKN
jgi:hypothetical protein